MGTWSIELPSSHPLASIDQTGKVTFQPHTEMTSYTIKFTGTTAETKCKQTEIRGNIVVYPCTSTTMCTYSVTPTGDKVPSTASSTKVKVGRWITGGTCSNLSWTFTNYEGEDFLTGFEVRADGFVYASITKDNPSSESRFAKYSATPSGAGVISGPSHFAVEQEGNGSGPVSECPNIGNARLHVLKPSGSTNTEIIQLTGADNTITSCTISSTVSWLQNLTIVGRASGVFSIMGTYTANTGSSIRYGDIKINKGSSNCGSFGVSQFPDT